MSSEVKNLYENNSTTQIAAVGGTFTLTLGAETTPDIDWNELVAVIQGLLEDFAGIGSGNVVVTDVLDGSSNRIGLIFTFQGDLADTNVSEMTVNSSLLQAAHTITVTPTQSGAADVPVTPTLTTTVSTVAPVAGVQAVWTLDFTGATSGTFQLFDSVGHVGSVVVDIATLLVNGASYLQTATDQYYGSGKSVVAASSDTVFTITLDLTCPYLRDTTLVYGNPSGDANGLPTPLLTTAGVAPVTGVYQQERLTVSAVPTFGTVNYNLVSGAATATITIDQSSTAASIQSYLRATYPFFVNITVTGNFATGFVVTINDTQGTDDGYHNWTTSVDNYSTLQIAGRPQKVSVALTDSPTQGGEIFTIAGTPTTEVYNVDAGTLATATGWGVTGSGTSGTPWIFTAPSNTDDVTVTCVEDTNTPALLRKALAAVIVTTQQGGVPPTAPTNPSATPISTSEIDLAWTAGTTNAGVKVQMSLDGSTGWTLIATTAANATSYSVTTGLSADTKYYFRMAATNAFGDSDWSDTVNATTDAEIDGGGGLSRARSLQMLRA